MKTFTSEALLEDGLSIYVFHSQDELPFSTHDHDFIEIVYALGGGATQIVNQTESEMRHGDLILINKGSTHAYLPHGNFDFINVCFSPEVITERIISRASAFDLVSLTEASRIEGGERIISFDKGEREIIETLLRDMIVEYNSDSAEREAVLESYMTVLIAKILRKIRKKEACNGESGDIWAKITSYVRDNLDKRLTLEDIAKMCFYNPSYLCRAFREKHGFTLGFFIARERAARAAGLLLNTDISLGEICQRCGYADKSSLYRAFFKFYGEAPGKYREKNAV